MAAQFEVVAKRVDQFDGRDVVPESSKVLLNVRSRLLHRLSHRFRRHVGLVSHPTRLQGRLTARGNCAGGLSLS